MAISATSYTICLFIQLTFLFCDLVFNCVSLFPNSRNGLLLIFIFQDLFLILSITSIVMIFFTTYLFQSGLMEVLVRKFRVTGCVSLAYICASVMLHGAWLLDHWPDTESIASPLLIFLFTLQRCLSPWYYFFYKRAAMRVSDPRFYEDLDWVNRPPPTH